MLKLLLWGFGPAFLGVFTKSEEIHARKFTCKLQGQNFVCSATFLKQSLIIISDTAGASPVKKTQNPKCSRVRG